MFNKKHGKGNSMHKNQLYLSYIGSFIPTYLKRQESKANIDSIKLSMEIKNIHPKKSVGEGIKNQAFTTTTKSIRHCDSTSNSSTKMVFRLGNSHLQSQCNFFNSNSNIILYNKSSSILHIDNDNFSNGPIEDSLTITSSHQMVNSLSSKSFGMKKKNSSLMILADDTACISQNKTKKMLNGFTSNNKCKSISLVKDMIMENHLIRDEYQKLFTLNKTKADKRPNTHYSCHTNNNIDINNNNNEPINKLKKQSYKSLSKHRFDKLKKELYIERLKFDKIIQGLDAVRYTNEEKIRLYMMKLKYNTKAII